jgi:ubiquitin conjugation factor E4 B
MANPFEKALKPTGAHPPSITIKRTPGAAGVPSGVDPVKRHRELSEGKTASPARKPALPAQEESLEDFANRTLSQLFRITLDEGRQTDHSGHKLIYLPDLRQELEGEGLPPKLSAANLDTALMEACSKIQHTRRVLDYLLPCWKRITRSLRSHKSHGAEKDEVLKEAKRLCMSSCIFAITVPELYGREDAPVKDSLVPYFLVQPDADTGICPDFLKEAVSRLEEDDTIAPMLVKAVAELSTQLAQKNMNDDYQPYVVALKNLTQFPPITKAIAESPLFTMAVSAPNIEKMTILGPFFRISPLNPEVSTTFFGSPQTMNPNEIRIAQDALRMSLTTHQKDLFQITNAFVRASDVSKDRTLDWLAHIVNTNHMRAASRPDERKVSSDAFLYNVTVVLDCMCEPAMDSTFSRIGKIDPEYFRRTSHGPKGPRAPKVDIKEETKLNADQKSSDAFYERKLDGTPNFLSELFYITLAAHHYGTGATITRLGTIEREIRQLNRMLAEMAEERTNLAGNPFRLQQLDMALNRYKAVQTNVLRNKLALEAIMSDKDCQARSLIFMRYVSVFVLRMASGRDYIPGKPFALPLSLEEPEIFKNYPEYMVEEVVNHYKFIFRYALIRERRC